MCETCIWYLVMFWHAKGCGSRMEAFHCHVFVRTLLLLCCWREFHPRKGGGGGQEEAIVSPLHIFVWLALCFLD